MRGRRLGGATNDDAGVVDVRVTYCGNDASRRSCTWVANPPVQPDKCERDSGGRLGLVVLQRDSRDEDDERCRNECREPGTNSTSGTSAASRSTWTSFRTACHDTP